MPKSPRSRGLAPQGHQGTKKQTTKNTKNGEASLLPRPLGEGWGEGWWGACIDAATSQVAAEALRTQRKPLRDLRASEVHSAEQWQATAYTLPLFRSFIMKNGQASGFWTETSANPAAAAVDMASSFV